jgi:hypothetical protein
MRVTAVAIAVALTLMATIRGQEPKPVPKDSVRVYIPGCTKGYVLTVGRRTVDEPGNTNLPEGTHLRMNGPKALMGQIKAHEGSMVEITGLMKKGLLGAGGITVGGVRIEPGAPEGGRPASPVSDQIMIDVEGWRQIAGRCPSR